MSPDDPGVMGNLPRSRPGRRSSKRDGGNQAKSTGSAPPAKPAKAAASGKARAAGKSAAGRTTAKKTTPRRSSASRSSAGPNTSARTRARTTQKPAGASSTRETTTRGSTDPVTGAVMLAGKVVEGGLKVAGGIIKRLPRP